MEEKEEGKIGELVKEGGGEEERGVGGGRREGGRG